MKWIKKVLWLFIAGAVWWMILRPAWQEGWIQGLWRFWPYALVAVLSFYVGFLAAAILAVTGKDDRVSFSIRKGKPKVVNDDDIFIFAEEDKNADRLSTV